MMRLVWKYEKERNSYSLGNERCTYTSRYVRISVQGTRFNTTYNLIKKLLIHFGLQAVFTGIQQYFIILKVSGSITDEVIRYFNLLNPFSRTMALGSTQPVTEMSIRNLPGGKKRPVRKSDNLTANCEPIV
jgi:hypothetical protein